LSFAAEVTAVRSGEQADVVVDRRGEQDGGRRALVLPGGIYTADMPLLYYTIRTLWSRRWMVDVVRWRPPRQDYHRWARERTTHLIQESRPQLVVGKSLGTWGLPAATALDCAGIWLTPLLHDLGEAFPRLDRRHLLVGGTADRYWDPAAAAATGAQVMEIPGASHNLETDDVAGSVTVLAHVQQRLDGFLADLDRRPPTAEG
jgi:hypothetical protein